MKWPRDCSWVWHLLYVVAMILKPFFLRLKVENQERIPATGGCVVACNHTLGPDYVILGACSPRQIFYMAKSEIFHSHPWLTRLLWAAGAFPIRRGKGDLDALANATEIVRAGRVVGMFPEGTRSRDGQLQRGRSGAARIAMRSGAQILPAVVVNTEPVLRDVLKLRRRPLVTVRFGAPFYLEGDPEDVADVHAATTTVMRAIAALLPPERRGYYADDGDWLQAEE